MFRALWTASSFGERYDISALFYAGIAVMIFTIMPSAQPLQAGGPCGAENNNCPEGQVCCAGSCIPEGHVCCDDGSHGPADSCACCTGCESACSEESTLHCQEQE